MAVDVLNSEMRAGRQRRVDSGSLTDHGKSHRRRENLCRRRVPGMMRLNRIPHRSHWMRRGSCGRSLAGWPFGYSSCLSLPLWFFRAEDGCREFSLSDLIAQSSSHQITLQASDTAWGSLAWARLGLADSSGRELGNGDVSAQEFVWCRCIEPGNCCFNMYGSY